MADVEALGRLISLSMRSGVDPKDIITQLKPCSNGILLMPPLGKYYLLEDILS